MKEIAKNDYYELKISEAKNRIYWTMKGFWRSMAVVPDFDKDWDTTQNMAKPGWTLLGDLSELKPMPDDVRLAQDERQKKAIGGGCIKVSCIVDSVLTKMSLNKSLKGSGMDKMLQYFDSPIEAEQWLEG